MSPEPSTLNHAKLYHPLTLHPIHEVFEQHQRGIHARTESSIAALTIPLSPNILDNKTRVTIRELRTSGSKTANCRNSRRDNPKVRQGAAAKPTQWPGLLGLRLQSGDLKNVYIYIYLSLSLFILCIYFRDTLYCICIYIYYTCKHIHKYIYINRVYSILHKHK